jgi:hypothetical protein
LANEDAETYMQTKNYLHSTNSSNNYSPVSPPRPGFPKRIMTSDQRPQNDAYKKISFDAKKGISSFPTSSTLIPTTLIKSNAFNTAADNNLKVLTEQESSLTEGHVIPMDAKGRRKFYWTTIIIDEFFF